MGTVHVVATEERRTFVFAWEAYIYFDIITYNARDSVYTSTVRSGAHCHFIHSRGIVRVTNCIHSRGPCNISFSFSILRKI